MSLDNSQFLDKYSKIKYIVRRINNLGIQIAQIDVSGVSKAYVDGSIANFIKDSSFNPSDFVWNGVYFDVSTAGGGVSQAYVDASFGERDISINTLFAYDAIQDASIAAGGGGGVSQAYVDSSLGERDISINTLFSNDIIQDTSIGYLQVVPSVIAPSNVLAFTAPSVIMDSHNPPH